MLINATAVTSDGTLWTWGTNVNNQLGDNTTILRSSPVLFGLFGNTTMSSPVQVGTKSWLTAVSGNRTTAAIDNNRLLFVWGENTPGINGATSAIRSPTQVGSSSWTAVSTNSSYIVALNNFVN